MLFLRIRDHDHPLLPGSRIREKERRLPDRGADGSQGGEIVVLLDRLPERRFALRRPQNHPGRAVAGLRDPQVDVIAAGAVGQRIAGRPCLQLADEVRRVVGGALLRPEFQKRDDTRSKLVHRDVCPTQTGVRLRDGQFVGIAGQVDLKNMKTLSGSQTFEVPVDGNPKVNKKVTITWNLKRCR